ncbi:bacterioferritin [Egicoccus halophilus]|uniref:Bacterioferritin n=1 Tax=Egicoccus halophilus TaxID=1670830 RepID=A0A8J3ACX2_9ACTN|nr:bacterioferritin [Egicoccus halophilus]GGI09021.1 bacterioferritin [Egicoccus halophilus]
MRGDERVLELLNDILTFELTLINQYWLNYRMLNNWGLYGLGEVFKKYSLEEMEDADKYIDRILFLDGHPNLQRMNTVQIGESAQEMLQLAMAREAEAVDKLNAGIALCQEVGDNGTRELLAEALREEEEHLDFYETQLDAIELVGLQGWLANFTLGASEG